MDIGIIGCGKIAQVRHIPEYAANPHATLVGFYDLSPGRAAQVAAPFDGRVYDSWADLLADPGIDAVSVCTANVSHAEIVIAALRAGK
ncbi:MAG: Gfo/Idh/MocA family oxidoreductase, partial [Actinomycetia bacterium]|nr:Gfo/Idh/MocA family oxidoreductase [Actinomycetes bacterium]